MNLYKPDVGPVKIAKEIEHPSARKDAPVKLAQKCLLLWRAIHPLGCNLLSLSRVFTMNVDIILVGRRMLHMRCEADVFLPSVRHLDRQLQRGEDKNEGMEQISVAMMLRRGHLYI